MNILFYILVSILFAAAVGYFLPRAAIMAGSLLLLAGLFFVGACIYHEVIIPLPHDTSSYGMMATISLLTIIPMGIVMMLIGVLRKRR